jgi:hypothetical protein
MLLTQSNRIEEEDLPPELREEGEAAMTPVPRDNEGVDG